MRRGAAPATIIPPLAATTSNSQMCRDSDAFALAAWRPLLVAVGIGRICESNRLAAAVRLVEDEHEIYGSLSPSPCGRNATACNPEAKIANGGNGTKAPAGGSLAAAVSCPPGYDNPGGDLKGVGFKRETAAGSLLACSVACSNRQSCTSFTFQVSASICETHLGEIKRNATRSGVVNCVGVRRHSTASSHGKTAPTPLQDVAGSGAAAKVVPPTPHPTHPPQPPHPPRPAPPPQPPPAPRPHESAHRDSSSGSEASTKTLPGTSPQSVKPVDCTLSDVGCKAATIEVDCPNGQQGVRFTMVPPDTPEWAKLQSYFRVDEESKASIGTGKDVRFKMSYDDLQLKAVWKVSNPKMKEAFLARGAAVEQEMAQYCPEAPRGTIKLLHGTKVGAVKPIACTKLLPGTGMFGKGLYVSESPAKIDQYADPDLEDVLGIKEAFGRGTLFFGFVVENHLGCQLNATCMFEKPRCKGDERLRTQAMSYSSTQEGFNATNKALCMAGWGGEKWLKPGGAEGRLFHSLRVQSTPTGCIRRFDEVMTPGEDNSKPAYLIAWNRLRCTDASGKPKTCEPLHCKDADKCEPIASL